MTTRAYEGPGTPSAGPSEMEVEIDGGLIMFRIDADGTPSRIYLDAKQAADLGAFLSAASVVLPR